MSSVRSTLSALAGLTVADQGANFTRVVCFRFSVLFVAGREMLRRPVGCKVYTGNNTCKPGESWQSSDRSRSRPGGRRPNQKARDGTVASWRLYVIPCREGSSIKVPRLRGSLGGSAGPDLAPCPVAADLAGTDDLGQAQALYSAFLRIDQRMEVGR